MPVGLVIGELHALGAADGISPSSDALDAVGDIGTPEFQAGSGGLAPVPEIGSVASEPAGYQPAAVEFGPRPGDQILSGLGKMWGNVEGLGRATETPVGGSGPAMSPGTKDSVAQERGLFDSARKWQEQNFEAIFDFQLVSSPVESALKSLKSLLTQGGG